MLLNKGKETVLEAFGIDEAGKERLTEIVSELKDFNEMSEFFIDKINEEQDPLLKQALTYIWGDNLGRMQGYQDGYREGFESGVRHLLDEAQKELDEQIH